MSLRRAGLALLLAATVSWACRASQARPSVEQAPDLPTPALPAPALPEASPEPTAADLSPLVESIRLLANSGGRLDWSPDGTLIAYDAPDPQGYAQLRLITPDGMHSTCLTCGNPAAPTPLHIGNPAWHTSMKWLVVQGVTKDFFERFPIGDEAYRRTITSVGVGIGNELWAMTPDGHQFTQLTDVWSQAGLQGGVLHPHFSHSGGTLAWSQRLVNIQGDPTGEWAIMLADFLTSGGVPRLANIRQFQPLQGRQRLYETHSFSKDDRLLLFTSNSAEQDEYGYDIYTLDLESGQAARLTDTPKQWDEHAHYSPNGEWIYWISSMNAGASAQRLKTEVWRMRADGSDQQQVTFFNSPGAAMFTPTPYGLIPADLSWAPDGKRLAVEVITGGDVTSFNMNSQIVVLKLK